MRNRAGDPAAAAVLAELRDRLDAERRRAVPGRHHPWPYATSRIGEIGPVGLAPPKDLVAQQVRDRVKLECSGVRACTPTTPRRRRRGCTATGRS
jgi:hypothetical protein